MTVYADILVIVNLYIDFFLLWCVKKALHLTVKNRRLALGALAGAACSLTALLPEPAAILSLLWSLLSALGITAAAFWPLSLRTMGKAAAALWAFSLGLAGFFLFLLRFAAPKNVAVLGNVIYFDLSLPLLFFFTCGAYLVFSLGRRLLPGTSPGSRFRTLVVENQGVSLRLLAKADTGNSLREPFSGLPVILCRAESICPATPAGVLEFLENGSAEDAGLPQKGMRLIPFDSLGGGGLLPAFRPDTVKDSRTGRELPCWVAVCRRSFSAGEFDALLNPDQFPE